MYSNSNTDYEPWIFGAVSAHLRVGGRGKAERCPVCGRLLWNCRCGYGANGLAEPK
jgi:hypothetical protein